MDFSFLDNRKVEAASPTHQKALDHVVTVKSQSQFVTRHAGLGNHQNSSPESQAITDAECVFCQPFGREVLPELAPRERHLWKLFAPVVVVFCRIRIYGLLGSA